MTRIPHEHIWTPYRGFEMCAWERMGDPAGPGYEFCAQLRTADAEHRPLTSGEYEQIMQDIWMEYGT